MEVEDAIRRLILPDLKRPKEEQGVDRMKEKALSTQETATDVLNEVDNHGLISSTWSNVASIDSEKEYDPHDTEAAVSQTESGIATDATYSAAVSRPSNIKIENKISQIPPQTSLFIEYFESGKDQKEGSKRPS